MSIIVTLFPIWASETAAATSTTSISLVQIARDEEDDEAFADMFCASGGCKASSTTSCNVDQNPRNVGLKIR